MAKPKLVLYVDVVSPFAYLAFHVLNTSPVFTECDVTYVPVFLGGIMKETGNRPPISVPKKGEWTGKERLRWAKSFGVPMAESIPPGFPANTIKVQRALTAVAMLHPERLVDTLAAIYHASFAERKEVHSPESLVPIFDKIYGKEETKEILTKSTSDEVKKLLTAKTNEAIEEGSFGLPWYAGEYLQFSQLWQCVDWQKLQILKGQRSAFGALITSHKSQIIWDSRDRDLVVLVIGVGELCYNITGEDYASNRF